MYKDFIVIARGNMADSLYFLIDTSIGENVNKGHRMFGDKREVIFEEN